jgi:hypothetical protein
MVVMMALVMAEWKVQSMAKQREEMKVTPMEFLKADAMDKATVVSMAVL